MPQMEQPSGAEGGTTRQDVGSRKGRDHGTLELVHRSKLSVSGLISWEKIKPLLCLNCFPAAQTNINWLHGCSRGWRLPTRISLSGQCPCRPAAVRGWLYRPWDTAPDSELPHPGHGAHSQWLGRKAAQKPRNACLNAGPLSPTDAFGSDWAEPQSSCSPI